MILAAWTMCVCVLMLAVAIITLGSIYSIDESATAFSAVYSIMFALILFVYEFMKFGCCIEEVQRIVGGFYGANLGFLYFPTSRGFFLVFIAFLQFGAKANPGSECADDDKRDCINYENSNWMGILCGSLLIFEGCLLIFLNCYCSEKMKEKRPSPLPSSPPPASEGSSPATHPGV